MRRPLGIAILAVLLAIAALTIGAGALFLPGAGSAFLGGKWGAVLLAVACALGAFGLWKGLFAGWVAALAAQIYQAAMNFSRAEGIGLVLALLFPAIVVGYLFTKEAREWCHVQGS